MFSTEPVQTGIFHKGEQEFKTSIGGCLNLLSIIFLICYTVYALNKTFKKFEWNVEIEQGGTSIENFNSLEVNEFIRTINMSISYELVMLDYMEKLITTEEKSSIQAFIDYYGCLSEYDKYDA